MNNKQRCGLALVACLTVLLIITPQAISKKGKQTADGAAVFKQNCASCHAGGGNTVNPKKPLANSDKLESLPVFKQYLENPVGHMPYYKHIVNDRKSLEALYKYCKSLKPSEAS